MSHYIIFSSKVALLVTGVDAPGEPVLNSCLWPYMLDPAMDVWPSLLPYYSGKVDETFQARHAFYRQLFPPLNALIFGQVYDDRELVEEGREELAVELEKEFSP